MKRRVKYSLRIATLAAFAAAALVAIPAGVAGAETTGFQASTPASCVVHSLPSFVAQGEFATTATVADVIEVECDPLLYGTGSEISIYASQLFSRCAGNLTWYATGPFREEVNTRSVALKLDADGNATVALIAGPRCQAGESLITAHMDDAPFESFATAFSVLPPGETPEGVTTLPSAQVEDAETGSVATIVEAEFAGAAEKKLRIGSDEMLARCRVAPHVHWIREDRTAAEGVDEVNGLQLDNDGNAFVLMIGDASCYPGTSVIEADLEDRPFTTLTTGFTIEPPQPTAEPSVSIEKLQRVASNQSFTTSPLTSTVGKTVEYEIVVTNTANVSETIGEFTDPHCDPGTIAGGPGSSPLTPGQSSTFTCQHVLTAVGCYTNQASATARTSGGFPLTEASNEVEVCAGEAPKPGLTIEKLQQIAGSGGGFVSTPLTGVVGQTVEYEIIVTNVGNTTLAMSSFTDARCDPGTIAGGPAGGSLTLGQQTTYTCSHVLDTVGTYVNEASVTGTPPDEPPLTKTSSPVEVGVGAAPTMSFTVEKLQRVGGTGSFTAAPLAALVGQTVEYEIIIKNTGTAPLTISNFSDPRCDPGTIAGGPGSTPVAPGGSTTFTCQHILTVTGTYANVASVSGTAPGQPAVGMDSPQVEVHAQPPGQPLQVAKNGVLPYKCTGSPQLQGVNGPKRKPFTARVSATGVKQITFYLDGHHLSTMKKSQAKHGWFNVRVTPSKLSHGAHRLSFKTVMVGATCATVASARTFVRPFTARVAPRFTG